MLLLGLSTPSTIYSLTLFALLFLGAFNQAKASTLKSLNMATSTSPLSLAGGVARIRSAPKLSDMLSEKELDEVGQAIRALKEYEYQTLPGVNYTRIFHLRPGSAGEALVCDLETVSLDDAANKYEAISYVWGDLEHTEYIVCSGRRITVTTSLGDALRRFRHTENTLAFWADAICIDQSNDTEKGHQVKRMGSVYQNARRVVAWLGHDTDGIAEEAIKLVHEATTYLRQQMKQYGGWKNFPKFKEPYAICNDKQKWTKVLRLITLPWFERVWVIQEAGLAKTCTLMWDQHEISIVDVIEFTFWVSYRADFGELIGIPMFEPGKFADIFRCVQRTYGNSNSWRTSTELLQEISLENPKILFVQILDSGRRVKTTDKRDHVYAFFGHPLAHRPDGELLLEPDYSKENTTEKVFSDIAYTLLNLPDEALGVLVRVQHDSPESIHDPNLPSWVPRWDKGYMGYPLSLPHYWYTASGIGHDFYSQMTIEANRALIVNGFIFDRISWVSQPVFERNLDSNADNWEDKFRAVGQPFIEILLSEILDVTGIPLGQLEEIFSTILVQGYPMQASGNFDIAKHLKSFVSYRHMVGAALHLSSDASPPPATGSAGESDVENGDPHFFWAKAQTCHNRRLFYTESGRLGLGTLFTRPGDVCCIFFGIPIPVLLRETGDGNYRLVGDSYVHGVMGGELIEQLTKGEFERRKLVLV